jgi:predicted transposase YbfD/YdcC
MAARWVNVEAIGSDFESLADRRHTRNRKPLWVDIVVIAVCGMVCGCDGPTAIHRWASNRAGWLGQFLALPNGIPSRDCLRRLLMALKPEAFQKGFQERIAHAIQAYDSSGPSRLIAIDGKTCRGSYNAAHGLGPLPIVSVWASEQGIALGQIATEEKSNEITAIPRLLERIELTDSLITIDAMGGQNEIARDIVDGGGDFVISVKDNQPTLRETIETDFGKHLERDLEDLRDRSHETREAAHGRIDERSYFLTRVPADFGVKTEWPWVKAIGYSLRVTQHADGRETDETRYSILSRYLSGQRFSEAVRGHWGIESMHWVLDVNFRADDSRTRERTLGNNLSWLRRFAVTLLKRHPVNDSLRGKMVRCMMNTEFLTEVLTLQQH